MKVLALSQLLIAIVIINSVRSNEEFSKFNVFEKIKNSLKNAGKIFGFDHANGVAELVNEAFGKNSKSNIKYDKSTVETTMFSKFLRILGFDAKKVGAIALNAVIFLAQLISSSISVQSGSKISEAKKLKGNPMEWFLNNTKVLQIISEAQEKQLPEKIIQQIKEHSLDEDTGCIQLLICKTSPFIWNMQKNMASQNVTKKGKAALFEFLPDMEEFAENGEKCERKHPYCYVNI